MSIYYQDVTSNYLLVVNGSLQFRNNDDPGNVYAYVGGLRRGIKVLTLPKYLAALAGAAAGVSNFSSAHYHMRPPPNSTSPGGAT